MWIVRLALRRPYTFVIVALLIVLLGVVTILRTPTDIFPDVNIPVVSVIWSLTGTSVTDMEPRIVTPSERAFTTSVNDIEHIESQTMPGVGVIKVFFHPNTQIGPATVAALNNLPIKQVNGKVVYIHDVAQVRDGFAVQQNIVTSNGQRGSLLSVLKAQGASTLAIVQRVKAALPAIQATLPPELRITPLFDQSIFVRAALNGVVREGAIAAVLTGLMILVFLGSWRSTVIVAVSIPLSILTSLILLGALGYTINIMTLGGLGLAVGILVDDATVTLENVHRNLGLGRRLRQAILDGAQQIATPALVSTLSICCAPSR